MFYLVSGQSDVGQGQSQGAQNGGHAAGGQQGGRKGQQPRRPANGNQAIFPYIIQTYIWYKNNSKNASINFVIISKT